MCVTACCGRTSDHFPINTPLLNLIAVVRWAWKKGLLRLTLPAEQYGLLFDNGNICFSRRHRQEGFKAAVILYQPHWPKS